MSHRAFVPTPDVFFDAAERGRGPRLSGHTHGGRSGSPGAGARPHEPLPPREEDTFFEGTELVVSRGSEPWGLPVRVACPPEAVLLTASRERRDEEPRIFRGPRRARAGRFTPRFSDGGSALERESIDLVTVSGIAVGLAMDCLRGGHHFQQLMLAGSHGAADVPLCLPFRALPVPHARAGWTAASP